MIFVWKIKQVHRTRWPSGAFLSRAEQKCSALFWLRLFDVFEEIDMAVQTRRVSSLLSVSVVAGVALMGMMSCGGQGHTSDEMPMVGDV